MELFIPNILTVGRVEGVSCDNSRRLSYKDISVPTGSEFQKVYFEELVKKYYMESENFAELSNVARVYHEEYFGAGGANIKRWRINFPMYNVSLNVEKHGGTLTVKAL